MQGRRRVALAFLSQVRAGIDWRRACPI